MSPGTPLFPRLRNHRVDLLLTPAGATTTIVAADRHVLADLRNHAPQHPEHVASSTASILSVSISAMSLPPLDFVTLGDEPFD